MELSIREITKIKNPKYIMGERIGKTLAFNVLKIRRNSTDRFKDKTVYLSNLTRAIPLNGTIYLLNILDIVATQKNDH